MSQEPEKDPGETRLEALFDRTAHAPSDVARARLLRRASELAAVDARRPWMGPRVLFAGALAAAAAALFLVLLPPGGRAPAPGEQGAHASATAGTAATAASTESSTPVRSDGEGETPAMDEPRDIVAAVFGETAEPDTFDLGPLMSDDAVNGASGSGM